MSARQKILFFEQRSRGIACQQPPSPPSAPKAKPGMPSQAFFCKDQYVQYVTFLTRKMLNFLVGFLLVTSCLSWNAWNIFNRKSKRRYPWRRIWFLAMPDIPSDCTFALQFGYLHPITLFFVTTNNSLPKVDLESLIAKYLSKLCNKARWYLLTTVVYLFIFPCSM